MIGPQEIAPLSTPDPLVRGLPEPGVDDDADMYVLKVPSSTGKPDRPAPV